ncbi:DUF4136 domain-containing protein [Salegentibacter sp. F188]|uniref:DUF4136 domain-containing protein n=1 Tax=Autumnicola patrickiae TaxID=3075591 RepID=A0ABU3E6H0_9FLAO|nr:DUF4136 domain-containing protein [Salegentibacter sp. F188]MDT0691595.1 DUF4136 domain-containing protein [Salegentibacter sp. F188]
MDTDLSKYETFAYLPNSNVEAPGKNYNDEDVNTLVIETINENMKQAGYTLDRDNPDLLVLVSTRTNTETETTADPMYARYPYTGAATTVSPFYNNYYYRGYNNYSGVIGYNTDTYTYEEGTVVVDLVDRETKETVWKGISSENLYDETTTGAMRDLVNQIFDEYPLNN